MSVPDKKVSLFKAREILADLKKNGKKIVFTNGCFDILHPGHIVLLCQSREKGDFLVVGLNSDKSVKLIKGEKRPILSESERSLLLSSLECVDMVVLFDEETPLNLIKSLKPDILVKGGEYSLEEIVGASEVLASGGKVIRIPMLKEYSTTGIIDRIVRRFSESQYGQME